MSSDRRTTHGIVDDTTRTTLGIEDTVIAALEEELRRSRRRRRRIAHERERLEMIMRDDEEITQIVSALMEAANGVLI